MATLAQPTLSRSEWHAVSIALNDAAASGCSGAGQGLLGRLYTAVTGNQPPRPLADARLEMVRRFVCATRRHNPAANDLVPALEAQGFSRAQLDAIALLAA
ncbi:hypothetical protein FHS31_001666 [Sphingomonas vulcanisoli]|uniref:Uncharacterized protein n=1 Tax=Sphingomonas vulcanisoli TaxID=1658060 RepID=A0ABX0TRA3_9SPHN|nr:hypothetical protein [Sphingomonas vulcanisoli]NIJ08056.1 hypothetical protein [Sphingomonas vulcanisoli]